MSNRIIKESICASNNLNQLSWFEESLFFRLIVLADDYGRFDARPKIIRGMGFPLREIADEQISEALLSLVEAELIDLYTVDGRQYLQLKTWEKHQRVRNSREKYPGPICGELQQSAASCGELQQSAASCGELQQSAASCGELRPRARVFENPIQSESESKSKAAAAAHAREENQPPQPQSGKILSDSAMVKAWEDATGTECTPAQAQLIDAMSKEYGRQALDRAIREAVKADVLKLAYIEAILREKSGAQPPRGKTGKSKVSPGKCSIGDDYSEVYRV